MLTPRQIRERQLLRAIFGDQDPEDDYVTSHNDNLEKMVDFLAEAEQAAARAGRRGFHCYFCGAKGPLVHCTCGYGQKFGCGRERVFTCQECSKAHVFIANRLRELFEMKAVNRVRSRREQAYYVLVRAAAEDLDGDLRDIDRRPDGERLRYHLAGACPYDDEPHEFEANILKAFREAKFLSWQALAANYQKQLEQIAIDGLARLMAFGTQKIKSSPVSSMKPEDEIFYT
jgi:hypothetical protein